jgi:hypothetical protein
MAAATGIFHSENKIHINDRVVESVYRLQDIFEQVLQLGQCPSHDSRRIGSR